MEEQNKAVTCSEEPETKLLGAQVPEDIYWQFKNMASSRKETMQEAILNAAYLYLDADKEAKKNG